MKTVKLVTFNDEGDYLKVKKISFWYVKNCPEHNMPEGICLSIANKSDGDKVNQEIILPLKKIKKLLKGKL